MTAPGFQNFFSLFRAALISCNCRPPTNFPRDQLEDEENKLYIHQSCTTSFFCLKVHRANNKVQWKKNTRGRDFFLPGFFIHENI